MAATKRLLWLFCAASAVLGVAAQTEEDFSQPEIDSGDALASLNEAAAQASEETQARRVKRDGEGGCGLQDIHVRREW